MMQSNQAFQEASEAQKKTAGMKKPAPYAKPDPYIFFSDADPDHGTAWQIIEKMRKDGYRIAYDNGIEPKGAWDDRITPGIDNASFAVIAISSAYLATEQCRNELDYILNRGLPGLVIYLEEVQLPEELQRRLSVYDELHWVDYENKLPFFDDLYAAPGINVFFGEHYQEPMVEPEFRTWMEETREKSWLPPGFRAGRIAKMIPATLGYILALGLSIDCALDTGDVMSGAAIFGIFAIWVGMLFNYRNIRGTLRISKIRSKTMRGIVSAICAMIGAGVFTFICALISVILFGG